MTITISHFEKMIYLGKITIEDSNSLLMVHAYQNIAGEIICLDSIGDRYCIDEDKTLRGLEVQAWQKLYNN